MPDEYKYKAFISYSHADRRWAKWLHRTLETYRPPKHLVGQTTEMGPIPARLAPVFRDTDDLPSSPDLSGRIRAALTESHTLIIICSPSSAKSLWVDQEIRMFQKLGRAERIFALIVAGDPVAANSDADCFPPALRIAHDREGNALEKAAEPIAADARREAGGRSNARLKLIAGLLGVGLDDLRQREMQRRNRRLAMLTAGSLAITVVTSLLAVAAIQARNEADQRRQQAEDLLGFMVGDLRERLEPIGRLDLLEEVGNQAMRYFATVKLGDLTDEELARQAQVMTQLGEIRISELQYAEAQASFEAAFERSSALFENDPGNGERLFDRSQAEFWVAFVYWRTGELATARDWLARYLASGIELSRMDPTRDDWVQEVAYGYHNLAVLDVEAGNLDAAAAGFESELDTLYALQETDPNDARLYDIADAISWLGNIAVSRGELQDALAYFERSAMESQALNDTDPGNRQWQYNLAYALLRVSEVAAIAGDLANAADVVQRSVSIFDSLAVLDPDNREWQRARMKAWIQNGEILAARSDLENAGPYAEQAIVQLDELLASEPADTRVREHLADAYMLLAWIATGEDDSELALAASRQALDNLLAMQSAGTLNTIRTGKLASAYVLRGEALMAAGDTEAAATAWQHALDLLEAEAADATTHYLLDPWTRALAVTGRADEAAAVRGRLENAGYSPVRPWPDQF